MRRTSTVCVDSVDGVLSLLLGAVAQHTAQQDYDQD
jgi:hypothetical protein